MAVFIYVEKILARSVGAVISRTLLAGLGNPLATPKTMQKFVDQSWQLIVHVSMTSLELCVTPFLHTNAPACLPGWPQPAPAVPRSCCRQLRAWVALFVVRDGGHV